MAVALRGNIQDFGIAEVFQLIGQQRKSGALEFESKSRRVQILFDRGSVVSAAPVGSGPGAAYADMLVRCGYATLERVQALRKQAELAALSLPGLAVERGLLSGEDGRALENLLTRETLFDVLRWSTGSFDFRPGDVEHDLAYESMLGAEQILMEGLRLVDEWRELAEQIPSEGAVFRKSGDLEASSRSRPRESRISQDAVDRVALLIDGRSTVRRIIDLSRLGTFDAMQVLVELRREGLIEQVESIRKPLRARPGVSAEQVRGWAAAALPVAILLAIASATPPAVRGAEPPGFEIPRAPLDRVAASYEAMRARHVLEDFWMATGAWPASWEEAVGAQPHTARALAAPDTRPYYYRRREDGALLLAPVR